MEFISIADASALTQKPERTLRHYLSHGQLTGKKDGTRWLLETESLKASGFIKGFITSEPPVQKENTCLHTEQKPFKKRDPWSFGVFKEFFNLRNRFAEIESQKVKTLSEKILENLVAGFFEFDTALKINFYRAGRENLSHLWLELEYLNAESENKVAAVNLREPVLNVLSGISGTIRKIENSSHDKRKDSYSGRRV